MFSRLGPTTRTPESEGPTNLWCGERSGTTTEPALSHRRPVGPGSFRPLARQVHRPRETRLGAAAMRVAPTAPPGRRNGSGRRLDDVQPPRLAAMRRLRQLTLVPATAGVCRQCGSPVPTRSVPPAPERWTSPRPTPWPGASWQASSRRGASPSRIPKRWARCTYPAPGLVDPASPVPSSRSGTGSCGHPPRWLHVTAAASRPASRQVGTS